MSLPTWMDKFYGSHVVNISCINPIGILVAFWNSPPPPKLMGLGVPTKYGPVGVFDVKLQAVHRNQTLPTMAPRICLYVLIIRKGTTPIYTYRIHVWYIYLHLVDVYGKCRKIYHTWMLYGIYSYDLGMGCFDHQCYGPTEGFGFLGWCRNTRIKTL